MNKAILITAFLLLAAGSSTGSDSLNITFVHEIRYSGYYEDVKVAGDIAYCANGYGLVVLDVVDTPSEVVYEFGLHEAYPNPFNTVTTVRYDIARSTHLNISVYDVNGRLVESLFDGTVNLGSHSLTWDASHLSSGLYLIRMDVGERHYYTKAAFVR